MVTHVQEYVALWDLLRKLNTITPGLQLGFKDAWRDLFSSFFQISFDFSEIFYWIMLYLVLVQSKLMNII